MNPANTFVATFIGSPEMALIPARAAGGKLGHDAFVADLTRGGDLPAEVLIGLRPEEVTLSASGMARATVTHRELIGAEALVEVALGGDRMVVKSPVQGAPLPGDGVGLDFDMSRMRLFDRGTGRAILAQD